MKIGDKVRFLSEVGGGIVTGFQGKNVVLVRDEDGFDIPMLIRECVVVDTDDYNIAKVNIGITDLKGTYGSGYTGGNAGSNRFRNEKPDTEVYAFDDDEDTKKVTFVPKPLERREGEQLNIFLAFVPVNVKELSNTRFETYLINDSNYYLDFTYMSVEGVNWHLRFHGTAEPNTKVFMEEFGHSDLNDVERIAVQLIAYKQDKPFQMKAAQSIDLRLDLTKFYKLHTFTETVFFEDPAWVFNVVRNDHPARNVFVDVEQMKEAVDYIAGRALTECSGNVTRENIAQYIQSGLALPVALTGMIMLPGGIINAVVSALAGRLYDSHGAKMPARIGFAIALVGAIMLALVKPTSSVAYVICAHIIMMIGCPLAMSPAQTHALNALEGLESADGSTIMNTMQQIVGAIATALATSFLMLGQSFYNGANKQAAFTNGVHFGIYFTIVLAVVGLCLAFKLKDPAKSKDIDLNSK